MALLSLGRAHDEPVALAGVLTAGAVAVPLDATAPAGSARADRAGPGCRALVLDAAAAAGLADGIDAELGGGLPRVELDAEGRTLRGAARADTGGDGGASGDGGACDDRAQDVACILHTSGSTGEPKPVPITWAGLDAFTAFCIDLIGLTPADRVLRVAELVFDLAWFDHLATFRAGATLATMARRDLASGRALRDAVSALAPTVIYGVSVDVHEARRGAAPRRTRARRRRLSLSPPCAPSSSPARSSRRASSRRSRRGARRGALQPVRPDRDERLHVPPGRSRGARRGERVPIGVAALRQPCALLALDADD